MSAEAGRSGKKQDSGKAGKSSKKAPKEGLPYRC
jgi:hypothetical protein